MDHVRWILESEVVVDVYEGLRPGSRNILLDAVTGGHTEIVELLLTHNIDVNEMNSFTGKTALHFAASGGHEDITRLLLEAGADVHKADSEIKTPLCQAVKEVNNLTSRQIIDRCRSGEAEITAEWFRRLFEPRIQAIWTLVEYGGELSEEWFAGCDIFKADSRGRTPLHIVNAAGDDEMVKLLYAAR